MLLWTWRIPPYKWRGFDLTHECRGVTARPGSRSLVPIRQLSSTVGWAQGEALLAGDHRYVYCCDRCCRPRRRDRFTLKIEGPAAATWSGECSSLRPFAPLSRYGCESAWIWARTKSMVSPSLRVAPRLVAEANVAGPSRSRRSSTRSLIRCASAASNGKAYAEPAAVSAPWSVAAARSARS